jgi:hypothetical protein
MSSHDNDSRSDAPVPETVIFAIYGLSDGDYPFNDVQLRYEYRFLSIAVP